MIGNALILGFFTAIGWFSAQKLMINVFDVKTQTQIEQNTKEQDMTTWYSIFVLVNGQWECAHEGNMKRSTAEGLFNQFAQQYSTRLFRGKEVGKLLRSTEYCISISFSLHLWCLPNRSSYSSFKAIA